MNVKVCNWIFVSEIQSGSSSSWLFDLCLISCSCSTFYIQYFIDIDISMGFYFQNT